MDAAINHPDIQFQLDLLCLISIQSLTSIVAPPNLNHAAMFRDRLYALDRRSVLADGHPATVRTRDILIYAFRTTPKSAGAISRFDEHPTISKKHDNLRNTTTANHSIKR